MPGGLSTSPYTSLEMSCLQQNLVFWCPTFEPHNSFVCIVSAMLFHIMKPTATQREERECAVLHMTIGSAWHQLLEFTFIYIHYITLPSAPMLFIIFCHDIKMLHSELGDREGFLTTSVQWWVAYAIQCSLQQLSLQQKSGQHMISWVKIQFVFP